MDNDIYIIEIVASASMYTCVWNEFVASSARKTS